MRYRYLFDPSFGHGDGPLVEVHDGDLAAEADRLNADLDVDVPATADEAVASSLAGAPWAVAAANVAFRLHNLDLDVGGIEREHPSMSVGSVLVFDVHGVEVAVRCLPVGWRVAPLPDESRVHPGPWAAYAAGRADG